jgi:hypothetical protein
MDLDDLFIKSYLNDMNEKERKKVLLSQEDRAIALKKKEKISVIEKFLQKFVDLEVYVNHSDFYTKNTKTMEGIVPQKFHFYYVDSNGPWAPGASIWFDHPATVEIAIPNNPHEEGVVVIRVASEHVKSHILTHKFYNYKTACEALGQFLSFCTTSIGKDPKKYMREIEQKRQIQLDKNTQLKEDPQDIVLNSSNHFNQEKAVLKETNNSPIKKIGEFFHISKSNRNDDDDD